MKPKSIIVAIILIISFIGCNAQNEKKKANFSELTGPYLGLKLPGIKPEKFPGKKYYRFFNEGRECYFIENGIWYTKLKDGKWTFPINTNIDYGQYSDFEMNISPDGNKVFFNSLNRPIPGEIEVTSCQTWISERKGDKWTSLEFYGKAGMYVTSTMEGTIYFTNTENISNFYIAKSKFINGNFQIEEVIPEPVFSESNRDAHPCVAPDES